MVESLTKNIQSEMKYMIDMKRWHKQRETLERRLKKILEANPVDVVAFNAQREKLRDIGYDNFCNGHGLSLNNAICNNIDLENTEFSSLNNASLDHAKLRGSSFDYTSITDTSFQYADLRNANHLLTKPIIRGTVDFSYADLRGVRLGRDYRRNVQEIMYDSIFKETKITPEQEQQLVREFGIDPQYMVGRFQITPSE